MVAPIDGEEYVMMSLQEALERFEPEGMARSDAGLQERRSSETRIAILEAAINCLAEHGYAKTTTLLVSSMARASRGAMLHHYPTRQALIEATIEYAFYKRLQNFISGIQALTEKERVEENRGLYAELKNFQKPEFRAYMELHMASRTDKELRDIFLPLARQFDQVWRSEMLKTFPEWQDAGDLFDQACKLTRSVLEGLLINQDIWDDPAAEERVIQTLVTTLAMMRTGKLVP